MSFLSELPGAVVLGPMTKGSNLPYRRLCVELGARITVSEMTVARRLKQKRRSEFALIRRAPDEPCFGVQLAGNQPDEMAWAAALVASRGAEFVDVNLGCPIDYFTSKGLGAALARQPKRVQRIVDEMVRARYERLVKSKGENVLVGVQHGVCGGCHMKLPAQTLVACQAGQELVSCTNCGRILYYTRDMELAGAD